MAIAHSRHSLSPAALRLPPKQLAALRRHATPLGVAILAIVAFVLITTMDGGAATPAPAAPPLTALAPAVSTMEPAAAIDPFHEQKKAAPIEELPAQF